jgi:hypothetical protein
MDNWQNIGPGAILLAGVVIFLGVLLNRLRKPIKIEVMEAEERLRAEHDAAPKCVCGELARFPAPVLQRDRGGWNWLRNFFAAPPSYRRVVDMMQPSVFCQAHAHVADAVMDQFIFRVRSDYSALNARIAADAAGFEQESLLRLVGESLTENQKRATRRTTAPIRVLSLRNGTDDSSTSNGEGP